MPIRLEYKSYNKKTVELKLKMISKEKNKLIFSNQNKNYLILFLVRKKQSC